jgi:hypothetical protein
MRPLFGSKFGTLHLIKLHLAATWLEPASIVLQRQDGLTADIATQQLK